MRWLAIIVIPFMDKETKASQWKNLDHKSGFLAIFPLGHIQSYASLNEGGYALRSASSGDLIVEISQNILTQTYMAEPTNLGYGMHIMYISPSYHS